MLGELRDGFEDALACALFVSVDSFLNIYKLLEVKMFKLMSL